MEVGVLVAVIVAIVAVAVTLVKNSKGVAKSRGGDGFSGDDPKNPDENIKPQ